MREAKMYLVTACISFTIVMLLSTILFDIEQGRQIINSTYVYHTFIVCCCVSGMIFITDYFMQEKSEKAKFFVRLLDMYIVVVCANIIILKNWNIDIVTIIINLLLLLITFLGVYFLLFLKNKSDEISINKKIKERNKKHE